MTPPTKYGRPQFAYETWPERSRTVMTARSSRRRSRVAADIPPATPPTTTTRIGSLARCDALAVLGAFR